MFIIAKEFTFEAAHHLPRLPEGHKCRRPHGHSYRVIVEFGSQLLDEQWMVVDFAELAPIRDWINQRMDHRDLNDLLTTPTAEAVAEYLHDRCSEIATQMLPPTVAVRAVRVYETATSWAEYRP
jgi:6-pyruvoyltetrahydropterin/6-carboxytetrahydropterin synthase